MRGFIGLMLSVAMVLSAHAQSAAIRMMTNKEALLTITASNTSNVTLRAFHAPPNQFNPILTFRSTGVNNHLDGAAPYLNYRFYYAQYAAPNAFLGDHVVTTNGELIIQPVTHASFVMSWNGKTIYNDPAGSSSLYAAFPKADLILISHDHSDHFVSANINSITNTNTVIVTSLGPYNKMSVQQRGISKLLTYGQSTNAIGITIEAVPAYNGNHPYGTNNAYVLNVGGKRILMTGDCGGPGNELRALPNIDYAFICMNSFTFDVATAASVIRDMRPKVVFPYHYGTIGGSPMYDVQMFKNLVGQDRGIEVRLRKWY